MRSTKIFREKYFELAIDPRSAEPLINLLTSLKIKFDEITTQARITFYGPKALERIIEAFNVQKTTDDNMFNDVLDGATLLQGVWFRLNGIISS